MDFVYVGVGVGAHLAAGSAALAGQCGDVGGALGE
jgi:hypothetical protein